ncbi:peptidyl-prolyl cis-trans isomerase [Candidatus Woesearchaeota archaeon]|nr:peptidyl-prolyl cis-trans isomerase [Candidatus Woesearchaeota archaeon]
MKLNLLATAALALMVAALIAGCSGQSKEVRQMNPHVILETTKGTIEIELYPQQAPVTVENFLHYASEGFYDGTVFHRVMPGFMAQGGGFTPDGTQKETHEPIKLESSNGLKNELGTVAMARTMIPDSATSQFFINVANNDFLNHAPGNDGYAVFGRVVKGMNVASAIVAVKTGSRDGNSDWPVEDIVITKAYVKK